MEKIRKRYGIIILCILLCVSVCTPVEAAGKVKLNKTNVTIYVGKTTNLKIKGTTAKVKWSSSDSRVAKVSKTGKVTAKKPGKAIIKAKVKGKTYKCRVKVKRKIYTNAELERMALRYYERNSSPGAIAWATNNGKYRVSIRIYYDMEDHIATMQWYYDDRRTGKGTDFFDNKVDLTKK